MSMHEMTDSDRPMKDSRFGPHRLPTDSLAPRHARAFVAEHRPRVPGDLIDTSELLVSEVVTNVVLHTSCPTVELTVQLLPGGVRVEVADCDGRHLPELAPVRPMEPGGVGMRIVDELSSTWGVRGTDHGKVVWFEVRDSTSGDGLDSGR